MVKASAKFTGTKMRVLKKTVASKVKRPEDIPVTREFEELTSIEDVRPGDYVLSWNEKTGRKTYSKVTDTYTKKASDIYTLTLQSGEKIETTWNHSFRVMKSVVNSGSTRSVSLYGAFRSELERPTEENSEWKDAKSPRAKAEETKACKAIRRIEGGRRLKKGDVLFDTAERQLRIRDVSVEKRSETVYNFTVEAEHDYYVGEDGVLVHNTCSIMDRDRQYMFNQLQALTDDELQMDKNGKVTIKKRSLSPKRKAGTGLVFEIIDSAKNVTIESSYSEVTQYVADSIEDSEDLKKGSGGRILYNKSDENQPFPLQYDYSDHLGYLGGNKSGFKAGALPPFIQLGHELAHAQLSLKGMNQISKYNVMDDGIGGFHQVPSATEGWITELPVYRGYNNYPLPFLSILDFPFGKSYQYSEPKLLRENGFAYKRKFYAPNGVEIIKRNRAEQYLDAKKQVIRDNPKK